MFKCPHCMTPCQTLRQLFTCCPRQLRAYTDECDRNADGLSLFRLITNGPTQAMRRRVLDRLYPILPEATQEVAA